MNNRLLPLMWNRYQLATLAKSREVVLKSFAVLQSSGQADQPRRKTEKPRMGYKQPKSMAEFLLVMKFIHNSPRLTSLQSLQQ